MFGFSCLRRGLKVKPVFLKSVDSWKPSHLNNFLFRPQFLAFRRKLIVSQFLFRRCAFRVEIDSRTSLDFFRDFNFRHLRVFSFDEGGKQRLFGFGVGGVLRWFELVAVPIAVRCLVHDVFLQDLYHLEGSVLLQRHTCSKSYRSTVSTPHHQHLLCNFDFDSFCIPLQSNSSSSNWNRICWQSICLLVFVLSKSRKKGRKNCGCLKFVCFYKFLRGVFPRSCSNSFCNFGTFAMSRWKTKSKWNIRYKLLDCQRSANTSLILFENVENLIYLSSIHCNFLRNVLTFWHNGFSLCCCQDTVNRVTVSVLYTNWKNSSSCSR